MNETTALTTQAQGQFSAEQQQMIRDSLASGASTTEFAMLMEVAKARNLNPITRQIHFVKRWDGVKNREVWSYQVSIDGLRAIAERTGRYDGQDEPEFEYEKDGKIKLARVRVYKKGIARPFVGVAYWSEYVQTKKGGEITHMWATKGHIMIAKCAEALGLRKAFPEDTSGLYTEDELPRQEKDITPPPVRGAVNDDSPAQASLNRQVALSMIEELARGFRNWDEKRAWADANHDAKSSLSPADQARVTAAFKAAHPTKKAAPVEPPHDEQTGEVRDPGSDDEPPMDSERIDPSAP